MHPLKCAREGSVIVCRDCGTPIPRYIYRDGHVPRTSVRCDECRHVHHLYMTLLTGKGLASLAVSRAKKLGLLRPASEYACVDCGAPAKHYDHRDYNRPLDVEPVCRSHNIHRGRAIPFNPLLVGLLLLGARP